MKRRAFLLLLACTVSAMLFTGCDYDYRDENWISEIYLYNMGIMSSPSGMKNIDSAHKETFESVFNNIEIFGARLCLPMKVSELPDKFELSGSYDRYVPLSEEEPSAKEVGGGLKKYSLNLYYDREVSVARIYVICKEKQNIGEGIIYEMEYNLLNFQPVLLGGQLDIHSDMEKTKAFLGEGNKFYDTSEYSETDYCTLFYTDGNRIIELSYGGQKDDMNFFTGYIRTYNNYEVGG